MADPDDEADAATPRRIVEHAIGANRRAPNRPPWAYLIAGPPGSGKSRLADEALDDCRGAGGIPVHVDGDRLRAYHPDYAALAKTDPARAFLVSQPYTSRWADVLRDAAIQRRLDLVIEGVFKTEANTVVLLDRLRDADYEVRLRAKIIPAPMSLLQIERRYERQMSGDRGREAVPRRVDAVAHDVGYRAVLPLLELFDARGLASGVSARDMENAPLSLSNVPTASWSGVVADLRSRPPTDTEQAFCQAVLAEVQESRRSRGAPEDPEPGSALEAAIDLMAEW